MRLVTWNVNHRIREKALSPNLAAAIFSLGPDVLILTEFVPGHTREIFYESLANWGLKFRLCSAKTDKQNHVMIFSRSRLEAGDIFAPPISPAVPSNVLHVRVVDLGMEVLGVRIPDFSKDPSLRRECWEWILHTAEHIKDRPFVILGDFNTDPRYPKSRCGDRIAMLVDQGWQHAIPLSGASFWTLKGAPVRIDHGFVSRHFAVISAEYVRSNGEFVFAGRQGLSDHAALVVDVRMESKTSIETG
jgi:endonuclease/exonuclease/phosphatase family metal-dependent hydrolase